MTPSLRRPVATAFLLPALLAAASVALAVAVAGLAGLLLGFVAVMLAIDRALDRVGTGPSSVDAERVFATLARQRRRRPLGELSYLPVDAGWAAVARRRRLGVQPIAIDSIVGTVDSHKAVAFDRAFRPPAWSRGRWTQLCLVARRGTPLPPISVFRAGHEHYVRDGHHRVSVARALGADSIDADVVELL
jgi:hypothetical protein